MFDTQASKPTIGQAQYGQLERVIASQRFVALFKCDAGLRYPVHGMHRWSDRNQGCAGTCAT